MSTKAEANQYRGHRKRLRERFMKAGIGSLLDYEVVELLLTFSIPQKDVKPIAKALIDKFGSIRGIFDAEVDELKTVPYVKDKTVELIAFIKEVSALYRKDKAKETPVIKTMSEIINYCIEKIGDKKEEEFHVIYLDDRFSVIPEDVSFPGKDFHFEGTLDRAIVYPRKVMEMALKSKAYAIIIAHNHPNGNVEPSKYDVDLTKALDLAAKSLEIVLYDHLIVSSKDYFSFRQNGFL